MLLLGVLVQIVLIGVMSVAVVATLAAIRRHSPRLAVLVLAGTLIHALSAGALFAISWFDAPVLRGLHAGDGFWHLAPDARLYYDSAAEAAASGLDVIRPGSPSPAFVTAVAIFMAGVGVHPVTPLIFNLLCYLAACAALVVAARTGGGVPDRALVWPVAGLSFAPILVFCGTQVLKDTFFALLVVLAAIAACGMLRRLEPEPQRHWRRASAGAAMFVLVIALIAGVRAYYPILVLGALTLAAGTAFVRHPRRRSWRYAVAVILVLTGGGLGFRIGAGPYADGYTQLARKTINAATGGLTTPLIGTGDPAIRAKARTQSPAAALDAARDGFALSGGGTNLVPVPDVPASEGTSQPPLTAGDRLRERGRAIGIGLAAIFVPVAVLEALSIVDIPGGQGLLLITDVDTVVLNLLAAGVLWTLYRDRAALRGRGVYLAFCLCLAAITAVLLAYVVTNLGTLVRLRLLMHVPIWMAVLAVSAPPRVKS